MRRVLALVLLALSLAACGISADASPQVVDRRTVPFGLLDPAPTSTVPAEPTENITIYLEGAHHLVTVNRPVPAPATIRSALAALGRGATSAETAANLQSPISTATPLSLRSVDGTTAVVNLPASFANLGGQDQIFAAAQLVYTLTLFPGVTQVSVRVGGQPAQVPTATGQLSAGPLTRADYTSVAPV